jgi:hypothetical protein
MIHAAATAPALYGEVDMTKEVRKYNIENDLRRALDGARLHGLIGYALINGWWSLVERYPDCKKTRWDFARSAVPVLQRAGVIALIDPVVEIPEWLPARHAKTVRRVKRPIWMMTPTYPWKSDLWKHFVAEMRGGEIIWVKTNDPIKRH